MHVHHAFAGRMPEQNRCQSRILATDITHEGFAWAMAHGCASHPEPGMDAQEGEALKSRSPVRIQWDPERDLNHRPLEYRAIQPSGNVSANICRHHGMGESSKHSQISQSVATWCDEV